MPPAHQGDRESWQVLDCIFTFVGPARRDWWVLQRVARPLVSAAQRRVEANRVAEWSFTSEKTYRDPFNEVNLVVVFRTPSGGELRVPAFWAGGHTWKVRYSSPLVGVHTFATECSDPANGKLHGVAGAVEIVAYAGENRLYRHGPIRVAADHRHFEHLDGTPFFWLGDTWWMGLSKRLHWPDDFQRLAADRKEKGFNVVQIVAGLYPDMPAFDPRGANEAGFPWQQDYARIRPEYFDKADQRIQYLADQGFVPCIVGAWGYHLPWLGVDRIKQHWRNLGCPIRGAARRMVCGRRGHDAVLRLETRPRGSCSAKARLDGRDSFDPLYRSVSSDDHHPSVPAPPAKRWPTLRSWISTCFRPDMHLKTRSARWQSCVRSEYQARPTMPVIAGESSYDHLDLREFGGGVLSSRRLAANVLGWPDERRGGRRHLRHQRHSGRSTAARPLTARRRTARAGGRSPGMNPCNCPVRPKSASPSDSSKACRGPNWKTARKP